MTTVDLMMQMINKEPSNPERIWCALCEGHDRKPEVVAPWWSPEGNVVCVYGACKKCLEAMQSVPRKMQSKLMDKVERQLIARHPELLERLPKGYLVATNSNDPIT